MSKITRDDIEIYVSNIVAWFIGATPAQLEQGRAWYAVARDLALLIGNGDLVLGAGIIAALSPNTDWRQNVKQAIKVHSGETFNTLPINLAKLARIVAGESPDVVLLDASGDKKKTWHFARNIIGDTDSVTIDRWAIRVALGYEKKSVTIGQYNVLSDAYRKAAAEIGESASTVQAVTWCAIRGTGE